MNLESTEKKENELARKIEDILLNKKYSVICYSTVTSTNDIAKALAENSAPEGVVVIAEQQTSGRGRRGGRMFYSPISGLYMSIILRPVSFMNPTLITSAAAVAVAKAIESVSDKIADIKWVNDVYCEGKKVSGILTEAVFDALNNKISYCVLGIGVNITEPKEGFPDEIKCVAGAITKDNSIEIAMIAAHIINNFDKYYKNLDEKLFFDEYKRRNFIIGKKIDVLKNDQRIKAKAIAIDNDCDLVVEYDNGTLEHLSSGEVSVRLS